MPTGNIDPIVTQLTERRRTLSLAASQLARSCGFPPSQIAMYESGARTPDVTRLRRWARELGVTIRASEDPAHCGCRLYAPANLCAAAECICDPVCAAAGDCECGHADYQHDQLDGRCLVEAVSTTEHRPERGSNVEAWIKHYRDQHRATDGTLTGAWHAVDGLLDDYREHADTGTPLSLTVDGPHGKER